MSRYDYCYTVRQHIAANVRHWREKQGLTQDELASKSLTSTGYIERLESERGGLALFNLCLVAVSLNVLITDLFEPREKAVTRSGKGANCVINRRRNRREAVERIA